MKVLVIRRGALGDVVHVAACFPAIKRMMPGAEITILTDKNCVPILDSMPDLDKIEIWPRNKGPFGLKSAWEVGMRLRRHRYDVCVTLMDSLKCRLICVLVGGRKVVISKQRRVKGGIDGRSGAWNHVSLQYFEALRKGLGLPPVSLSELVPRTVSPAIVRSEAKQRIAFVLGVAGRRANRAWPLGHFQELASLLLAEGNREIVLIGGKREKPLAESFSSFEGVLNQVGIPLSETIACLRTCDVVVGCDTGPMHIATSLDLKIVALFGPTAVDRTGPLGNHTVLTPPQEMLCWPCEQRICPLKGDQFERCMRSIEPAAVAQAVNRILATGC